MINRKDLALKNKHVKRITSTYLIVFCEVSASGLFAGRPPFWRQCEMNKRTYKNDYWCIVVKCVVMTSKTVSNYFLLDEYSLNFSSRYGEQLTYRM